MAKQILETAESVQAAADQFVACADDVGKRAKAGFDAGDISIEEFIAQIPEELRVRGQAMVLYSKAIDYVLTDAQLPQAELDQAIAEARAKIATIKQVRKAIEIFSGVVVLAAAIVARDANGTVKATKALAKLAKSDEHKPAAKAVAKKAKKDPKTVA
ncbi:hypothetical protein [Lysobacter sp. ESA13C]|uniref:hypothetical protein n=1 Tax=Lysobacter sp. ESA13C TaxID=2862676 RepID=UPI001CBF848B|nr:hypothetical protein [Lysobacter sp. ESA13C]